MKFLSNIGESAGIRQQISQTDISNQPVLLLLDGAARQLEVLTKSSSETELTVRTRDIFSRATIILHLPYSEGAAASADIIDYNAESNGA
jgi:hypothetical protein